MVDLIHQQVKEIIPDVDDNYLLSLIQHSSSLEHVLNTLFENKDYPRASKGKRKADDIQNTPPTKKQKLLPVDYLNKDQQRIITNEYSQLALNQLQQDYPYAPKPFLRSTLASFNSFYAPTFFHLRDLDKHNLPYVPKKIPTRITGKEKDVYDQEFQKEFDWVLRRLDNPSLPDQHNAEDDESDGEDDENGIECGCCFSKFKFEKMSQCPDAHLFCKSCLRSYASTLLGSHNINITCMSQSSCTLTFSLSELRRVLPSKLLSLYERLLQAKEISEANIQGLEECPFCEWKCVIDNDQEKLFRCGNADDCGVVSCRNCKKLDHLPKSCQEAEKDKTLDARHKVEEAMTQALMRNCPKCKKAFIKEGGCNKMTCPHCRTLSCYICRQIINGYNHFNQQPGAPPPSASSSKCILWDKNLDEMHALEVKKAAEEAITQIRQSNPTIGTKDLNVDLPKVPKSAQNPGRPGGHENAGGHGGQGGNGYDRWVGNGYQPGQGRHAANEIHDPAVVAAEVAHVLARANHLIQGHALRGGEGRGGGALRAVLGGAGLRGGGIPNINVGHAYPPPPPPPPPPLPPPPHHHHHHHLNPPPQLRHPLPPPPNLPNRLLNVLPNVPLNLREKRPKKDMPRRHNQQPHVQAQPEAGPAYPRPNPNVNLNINPLPIPNWNLDQPPQIMRTRTQTRNAAEQQPQPQPQPQQQPRPQPQPQHNHHHLLHHHHLHNHNHVHVPVPRDAPRQIHQMNAIRIPPIEHGRGEERPRTRAAVARTAGGIAGVDVGVGAGPANQNPNPNQNQNQNQNQNPNPNVNVNAGPGAGADVGPGVVRRGGPGMGMGVLIRPMDILELDDDDDDDDDHGYNGGGGGGGGGNNNNNDDNEEIEIEGYRPRGQRRGQRQRRERRNRGGDRDREASLGVLAQRERERERERDRRVRENIERNRRGRGKGRVPQVLFPPIP